MTFRYGYKTHENERREGEIVARSRDEVYARLKKEGIRPYFVELKPGLLNRIQAIGRRGFAIVVLGVLCLALAAVVVFAPGEGRQEPGAPSPRHQIYGDPALMESLLREDFASVFRLEGDRFLARYAQPGHEVPPVDAAQKSALAQQLSAALETADADAIVVGAEDVREVCELKGIVRWMRQELRRYLANGVGTTESYIVRLIERQNRELQLFYKAKHDLDATKDESRWAVINASLRGMGLRTISRPD